MPMGRRVPSTRLDYRKESLRRSAEVLDHHDVAAPYRIHIGDLAAVRRYGQARLPARRPPAQDGPANGCASTVREEPDRHGPLGLVLEHLAPFVQPRQAP